MQDILKIPEMLLTIETRGAYDMQICRKTLVSEGNLITSERKILPCHLLFPTCIINLTIILT